MGATEGGSLTSAVPLGHKRRNLRGPNKERRTPVNLLGNSVLDVRRRLKERRDGIGIGTGVKLSFREKEGVEEKG